GTGRKWMTENSRVTTVAPLEVLVAENRHLRQTGRRGRCWCPCCWCCGTGLPRRWRWRLRDCIVVVEVAPDGNLRANQPKEIGCGDCYAHFFRRAVFLENDVTKGKNSSHILEGALCALTQIDVVGI